MQLLCSYELEGPTLAPLYPFPLAAVPLDGTKHETINVESSSTLRQHPHLISSEQMEMLETKSHLILRMIELRIGQDLLMQVFNKQLSLATTAAARRSDCLHWHSMLMSTNGFLKTISTVSGKDINVFVDQWMYPFFRVEKIEIIFFDLYSKTLVTYLLNLFFRIRDLLTFSVMFFLCRFFL